MSRTHSTHGPRLFLIIKRWRAQLAGVFNPYRPELHYMRGPGPRWHARHKELHALRTTVGRDAD
jgi:hypothetical protein